MRSPTARAKRFLEAQFTARLDEQASQIQKVSAQLETRKPAPHVAKMPKAAAAFLCAFANAKKRCRKLCS
jgi:hypothetical protein